MRGRQVFFETLLAHGVDRIFGNPGTTESPLLDSLLDYPQLQYIVHLHEGVAVGAANFYAQASGKTAFVNLHVAPGLGNAIGMIYGALKNNSPMVVTAGQQDTRIRLRDPVLGHDLAAIAAPVTKWSVQVESADELGPILQRAFKIANDAPAGPVFVALPINVMEQETDIPAGKPATGLHGEPSRSRRHRGDGAADHRREESGDRGRRRRGARRRGQDAGEAGRDASAPRCGSRACAAAIPSRPIIRPIAARSPSTRRASPSSSPRTTSCCWSAGRSSRKSGTRPGSPFPAGCKVLQIEAGAAAAGLQFRGRCRRDRRCRRRARGAVAGDHRRSTARPRGHARMRSGRRSRPTTPPRRRASRRPGRARRPRWRASWPRSRPASPADVVVVDETITANLDLFKTFTFAGAGDYYSGRGGGIGQGVAGAHRRGGGRARPADPLPLGRRLVDVFHPGAVDGGASRPADRVRDPGQPRIPRAEAQYRRLSRALRREVEQALHAHGPDAARCWASSISPRAWASPARTSPRPRTSRRAVAAAFKSGKPHLIEIEIEGKR